MSEPRTEFQQKMWDCMLDMTCLHGELLISMEKTRRRSATTQVAILERQFE